MSNCKVIALTNQKGGVGKTTTAVNLGVTLAQQGKGIAVFDPKGRRNTLKYYFDVFDTHEGRAIMAADPSRYGRWISGTSSLSWNGGERRGG